MAANTVNKPVRVRVGVKVDAACGDCEAPLTEHCSACGGCLDPTSPGSCEGDCDPDGETVKCPECGAPTEPWQDNLGSGHQCLAPDCGWLGVNGEEDF
ncbi:hypothetical protein [Streptomyces sp. IBSBF 2950]|uniref:hypothetical protein n=1 Tax=Streptomyces sp. IBSBF 2950 TaxID=2903528 RepID=UPI002FDC52F0